MFVILTISNICSVQRALISLNSKGRWVHSGCLSVQTGWEKLENNVALLSLLNLSNFDIECNVELFKVECEL